MEPFKVTLRLATPMVASGQMMLDSVLAWCAVQEAGGDWSAAESLPLGSREAEGRSYWLASRFFYFWTPAQCSILAKRIPYSGVERFTGSKIKLYPGSGQYKAFCKVLRPIHVEKAVAYGVGDIDEVDYLLRRLTHFGKLVRSGYGRVKSVEVEPFGHDWSVRIGGQLVRNVPAPMSQAHGMGPYRPPYWDKAGWVPVHFASPRIPDQVKEELRTLGG